MARTLAQEEIYGFGLSDLEEVLHLREAGLALPLILLSGFEPAWLPEMIRLRAIPVVTDLYQLKLLADYTRKEGRRFAFHLKIDTGMHRLGISFKELEKALEILRQNPQLKLEGVMSHFACAEKPLSFYTQEQLQRFVLALSKIKEAHFSPRLRHIANSSAAILLKESHFDLVRPGLALYGVYPCEESQKVLTLRPAMTAKARILSLKEVPKGKGIGYGPLFVAPESMKIALVPVGYDDGYLRALSNKGFAWVKGKRVPVVGAVSMRLLALDVTKIEGINPGDEIILLGGKRREVPAEELSQAAGVISYELLCLLGKRAFKIYLRS